MEVHKNRLQCQQRTFYAPMKSAECNHNHAIWMIPFIVPHKSPPVVKLGHRRIISSPILGQVIVSLSLCTL